MSTEENKAMLRRVYEEALNKGDVAILDDLLAAGYVLHMAGLQDYKGPEGFKEMVTALRVAFPDLHVTIDDMVAEGDEVAHRFTLQGTHQGEFLGIAPTGKQVTVTGTTISRFAGGKEGEAWQNIDSLGMLRQMGVAPPMGQ
jgi:predicted ester cyclase